jgi:hypothetical protein
VLTYILSGKRQVLKCESRKRREYDDGSTVSEFDGMSTDQQHDMCDLQMGLGLSLSKRNCDVYGMMGVIPG